MVAVLNWPNHITKHSLLRWGSISKATVSFQACSSATISCFLVRKPYHLDESVSLELKHVKKSVENFYFQYIQLIFMDVNFLLLWRWWFLVHGPSRRSKRYLLAARMSHGALCLQQLVDGKFHTPRLGHVPIWSCLCRIPRCF